MANASKTYAAPWHGQILLACRKCQKKLKSDSDLRALAKLKQTIKRRNKEHLHQPLHVIKVACMDLCPKDGVTVCRPAREPNRLSIVRNEEDIEKLFDQ